MESSIQSLKLRSRQQSRLILAPYGAAAVAAVGGGSGSAQQQQQLFSKARLQLSQHRHHHQHHQHHQYQHQQQQQQRRRITRVTFASISNSNSSTGGPPQQQQQWRDPTNGGGVRLAAASATTAAAKNAPQHDGAGAGAAGGGAPHALFWLVGAEVAKLAGIAGAQLLLHLSTLPRPPFYAAHRDHHDGVKGSKDGSGSGSKDGQAPFRLLPWWWHRNDSSGGGKFNSNNSNGKDAAHLGPSSSSSSRAALAPAEAARRWVAAGAAAERARDLRRAIACYDAARALEPDNPAPWCYLSKAWSDLTYSPGADLPLIVDANARAIACADRAIELAPDKGGPFLVSCVARGRLALFSENRAKVKLAGEAHAAAVKALELDPGSDLAHHLMGRWHYEMAGINFVVRQLIRLVYGAALPHGSVHGALAEYRAAAALAPDRLIHRVELGRALIKLGKRADAAAELEASLTMDVEDINAALQLEDARAMLAKLRAAAAGHHKRRALWPHHHHSQQSSSPAQESAGAGAGGGGGVVG